MANTTAGKTGDIAQSLQTFRWKGTDSNGRRLSGEIRARDIALARAELRRQMIVPGQIRKAGDANGLFSKARTIKSKDITLFTRQLATMVDSGIPIVQALEIIEKGLEHPSMARLLASIRVEIESGANLSSVLGKHARTFDNLYVNLIAAGEEAGALDTILNKLALYREKSEMIKSKVLRAMVYPAMILVVATVVTLIILLYVIPQFEEFFVNAGSDLPALTRMVIDASHFIGRWGWLILLATAAAAWLVVNRWKKSQAFQRRAAKIALRLPVIGPILRNAALARFSRTLSTTFGSGVPIMQTLSSVASASGNALFGDAILRMRDSIAKGQMLNFAMQQEPLFPNILQQMTAIGEEAGSLEHMMGKAADYYEQEVDAAVDVLTSMIEPLIIVVIGVIVGTLVIAMFLPIFNLGDAI